MSGPVVVAVNPTAAFGRHRDVGPRVVSTLRERGYSVTALQERDIVALRAAIVRAIGTGARALVVVGGDGMVHLGTNLVAGTRLPLGIVPTGTGNDSARGLGIPISDPGAAITALTEALRRPPRVIDAGRVRHRGGTVWFACALSAGFDARVNERSNRMRRPRGSSRYVLAVLRELLGFTPAEYTITADGVETITRAMLVTVANNRSIGGGMRIVPDADVTDGLLDLFTVAPMSTPAFLRFFPKVFSGAHTGLDAVSITRVRAVSLRAEGVTAYADGERIGPLPVEIEVVPGALNVLA